MKTINILLLLISFASFLAFYIFILPIQGLALYPLIGSLIATHGSFIGMLVYLVKNMYND